MRPSISVVGDCRAKEQPAAFVQEDLYIARVAQDLIGAFDDQVENFLKAEIGGEA